MPAPMLEVHGLRAGYGGTQILQGVEFTVSRGEIVAIIGRNGVGKSTLMKTLIGLLEARTGISCFSARTSRRNRPMRAPGAALGTSRRGGRSSRG